MPKVKVPRKSTSVDMTAMTDVAFLLLTFFMLATQFKPEEPVTINAPSSVAEVPLPDKDMMTITISDDSRVFFELQGQQYKETLIKKVAALHSITFTPEQIKSFSLMSSFGVPLNQLGNLLNTKSEERAQFPQKGIPCDSLNNELAEWIWQSRLTNNQVRVAIKGDQEANFPVVKQVIKTLQDKKVNRFNFITNMSTETVEK
ncbi:MAG: biopolymer transporter ExbD [Bacteroidetes bacterium B1(2017)]|nr:MAG: biopolymer transporter ExbD [Bacteroidetes bacterium B1(2017)]